MKLVIIQPDEAIHGIGSRYLSAVLKIHGHHCTILFCPRSIDDFESPEEINAIVEFCLNQNPDLIGFSLMTGHVPRVKNISSAVRRLSSIPIVMGGVHPTVAPCQTLTMADVVCIGEGENVILDLAESMDAGKGFNDVAGLAYNSPEGIRWNNPGNRVRNLDSIPFPDYEGHSILHNGKIHKLSIELMKNYKYYLNGIQFLMTSRGCPGNCSFCCNHKLEKCNTGPWFRRRSVDNVIKECLDSMDRFPYLEGFAFWDDSLLTCSSDWLKEFCKSYKSQINRPFLCNLAPTEVTREKIRQLTDAGLAGIQMGLQSGSDYVNQTVFNRKAKASEFIYADMILNEFKDKLIDRYYHLISDNPWEVDCDFTETLSVLNRLKKPYYLSVFSLLFYPGTRLHHRVMKDKGLTQSNAYTRDFFNSEKTFKNRLLRATPVLPNVLVKFFGKFRRSSIVRLLFTFYYVGLFVPIHRKLIIWKYNKEVARETPDQPNRIWPSLKYRPR